MGHSRYDSLPKTKQWRDVLEAFTRFDSTDEELISSTLRAAESGLRGSQNDPYLSSSCWLLLQLPLLASSNKLEDWLETTGGSSTGEPRRDLLTGARKFFDQLGTLTPRRNILSETARLSFFETLTTAFKDANLVLFGSAQEEVRKALARYASPDGFQLLVGSFFKAFLNRSLSNLIEKELPNHVGVSEPFSTSEDTRAFEKALHEYCQEATALLADYSRDWYAKHAIHERPNEKATRAFAAYAVKKLLEEFERESVE